jgi:hypothetical protein
VTAIPISLPPGLENDPEVKAAMKKLALASIDKAMELLEEGAPAIQQRIVAMLLPSVTRSLATASQDVNGDLKEKVDAMYDSVRKAIGA